MKTKNNIPYTLFAKFFSGEISEKEQKTLDNFISKNTENKEIFNEYKIIWSKQTNENKFEAKTESALLSVKNKINNDNKTIPLNNKKTWLRIAASIIIILGISLLFKNDIFNKNTQFVTVKSGDKIKEYKLSDGSIVWLNKNSKIEFPEVFDKKKRIVKMTGEAYFIVSRNPKKPFIVKTEHTTTEVLGTEFNLKAFENEQDIEIVLNKGKVKFTDTKSNASDIMKINEKITLNKKERILKKETVKNANFLSWRTKELDLNNMSLEEIANILSDYYNLDVKADDSVKDSIFHTTLPFNHAKLQDVLNSLELSLGIEIDSIEGEVILRK
ncbi:MAG: FecR family protein [Bacteroidales bacterium]|nr:FecR family protein [Bacteroidales bacterium]